MARLQNEFSMRSHMTHPYVIPALSRDPLVRRTSGCEMDPAQGRGDRRVCGNDAELAQTIAEIVRLDSSPLPFAPVRAAERRLCRCELGDGDAVGRAGDVIQSDLGAEVDGGRVAAMLAADAELELGAGLAAALGGDLHQFADTFRVDADEGILLEDALPLVGRDEARGVVAAEAVGGLRQVVGAE